MTVSARGPRNILVLDRTNVPVMEVCDAVAEHKTFDWIKTRYPITDNEIFECLETFVDVTRPNKNDKLELRSVPDDDEDGFEIEAAAITDRIYFLIVTYAKAMVTDCNNIYDLFRYGLEIIISESLNDVKNGHRSFEASEIHDIVFTAFEKMHQKNTGSDITDAVNQFKISDDLEQVLKNVKS